MREPAVPTRANGPPPAAMTAKRPRPRAALLAAAAVLVSGTAVVLASTFGGGSPAPTAAAGSLATAAKDSAARGTPTPAVTAGAQPASAPDDRQRRAQAEAEDDELADELEVPARFSTGSKQRIAIARRYVAVGHRLLKRKKLGLGESRIHQGAEDVPGLSTSPRRRRPRSSSAQGGLRRGALGQAPKSPGTNPSAATTSSCSAMRGRCAAMTQPRAPPGGGPPNMETRLREAA